MKRIISFILLAVLFVIGAVFSVRNSTLVDIDFYFFVVNSYVSLIIIVSVMLGAVLGILASMSWLMKTRREIARLRRAKNISDKELTNLRNIPIRDEH